MFRERMTSLTTTLTGRAELAIRDVLRGKPLGRAATAMASW